jgi:hypothetical protein
MGLVGTNLSAPGLGSWCDESCRKQVAEHQNSTAYGVSAWQPTEDPDYPHSAYPTLYMPDPGQALLPFNCSLAVNRSMDMDNGLEDQEVPVVMCSVNSWTGILSPLWNTLHLQYEGNSSNEY